jgi:carboxyl-terminal processing protease
MSPVRRTVLLALALVAASAGGFAGGTLFGNEAEGFEEVQEAADRIQAGAASSVSEEELVRAAIRGMLQVLDDPYAAYLDPEGAQEARDLLSGSFVGIGTWLEGAQGGLRVTSVLDGSPAAQAGIVPGDLMVEVDGRRLEEATVADAAELLQGAAGTRVMVVVTGSEGTRELDLERVRISLTDVQARMLRGDVAYAHPLRFGGGTTDRLAAGLRPLLDAGARGLVLDLRGNPGGLAEEAVQAASLFLSGGVVARVRGADGEQEDLTTEGDPLDRQVPMAVLVDGGTASAAELVAGALQDRARAEVVGTPTFGKGAVLSVEEVGSGSAIRFTTGHFVTPDGHAIEGRGIVPDVAVLPGGPADAQLERAVHIVLEEGTG